MDPGDPVKGLGIAVLSSVLPYSFELFALRRMSAGVRHPAQPGAGRGGAGRVLVLDQRLTPAQLLGMALVVAACALVMGPGARKDPAAPAGAVSAGRGQEPGGVALVAAGLHQARDRRHPEDEHDGAQRHPDRDLGDRDGSPPLMNGRLFSCRACRISFTPMNASSTARPMLR